MGHLLALLVTAANEPDRAQVDELAAALQEASGQTVELADVAQGDTGEAPATAAADQGIQLAVVKRPEAKHGFGLLPRRGVVQRWCSVISPGQPVCAAWRATTSVSPLLWLRCPFGPSPVSCCIASAH